MLRRDHRMDDVDAYTWPGKSERTRLKSGEMADGDAEHWPLVLTLYQATQLQVMLHSIRTRKI